MKTGDEWLKDHDMDVRQNAYALSMHTFPKLASY
jgi:hypothetical protein